MAETGKSITRANFSSSWAGEYSDTTSTSNKGNPEWYYVSAASFVVRCYIEYTGWYSENPTVIVTCDCYDWGSKSWSRVFHLDHLGYNSTTNQPSLKFFHNRNAESDESSHLNYRDTDTSRKTALFRFRVERTSGKTSNESHIHVWFGGIGQMSDSEYANYAQGRPIISNGQLGSSVDNFVWYGGKASTAPDNEAIAKFNPENTKGTVIKKEYEYNCVPKWF